MTMDLVPTTEIIKNINVVYNEVIETFEDVQEDEFVITEVERSIGDVASRRRR